MNIANFLDSFYKIAAGLAGQPFGSWQFWSIWGVGLALVLLLGKAFAAAIGKGRKGLVLVFAGNLIVVLVMLAAACATAGFVSPHVGDAQLRLGLLIAAPALAGIVLCLLLGPVFWAQGRIASLTACAFALAVGLGGMYATQALIQLAGQGRASVGELHSPLPQQKD